MKQLIIQYIQPPFAVRLYVLFLPVFFILVPHERACVSVS